MNSKKCGICGGERGSCAIGTKWPDGALCAYQPDIDPAALPDLYEAVKKAQQLARIASDWNLDEVEIDGEMVQTDELESEFEAALAKARREQS